MAQWRVAASVEEVVKSGPLALEIGGHRIGLYCVDGRFFALQNVCPHAYALLTAGFINGDEVECPLHGAVFRISTGECLWPADLRGLERYETRVEDGKVSILIGAEGDGI